MNKQVNNRRDVSKCFQKNQSLWLPWQREVQVGSAPYVTNYVYVCVHVCIYHLGFLICKRESGSIWASAKNDFRAFYFNMVCLHLLSVSSSLATCLLAVYHQPQFLSSTLRTHEQQTKPCLHCCAHRLFTKCCTLRLYNNTFTSSSPSWETLLMTHSL